MIDQATIEKVNQIGEGLEIKPAILITGDTYSHKDTIKKLGGSWNNNAKGWFIPLENLNEDISEKTDPPTEIDKPTEASTKKGLKLTKAQIRKGMEIWNVKLEKLTLCKDSPIIWKVEEIMLESEIIAKGEQQVKIRSTKLIGDKFPDLKFSLSCNDRKWRKDKTGSQFTREFGITGKYKITVN